jgi:hypothetical protein
MLVQLPSNQFCAPRYRGGAKTEENPDAFTPPSKGGGKTNVALATPLPCW